MGFEGLSMDDAPELATDEAAMQALQNERQGLVAQQTLLQQPAFVRNDCACRGGRWVGDDAGYCLPADRPTGNYYDVTSRSCQPIGGVHAASSWCHWRGWNVCLWSGVLVGGALLVYLLKKKKGGGSGNVSN